MKRKGKVVAANVEADAPLLPGWKLLEHVTPRRPARAGATRGRLTWGIRYRDPHLPPNHAPVTQSTGKKTQPQALEVAKRVNQSLRDLHRDIDRELVQPKYLAGALIIKSERIKGGRLIVDAVTDAANAVPSDETARKTHNCGEHFARYAESVGVRYLHQITEELLIGFHRSRILQPDAKKGGALWWRTVNLWADTIRKILRREFKAAPQLNTDILRRALPCFGSQADMLRVFEAPTDAQREWILSRERGTQARGSDGDEGGQVLSQETLYRLLHVALRRDAKALRQLVTIQKSRKLLPRDFDQTRLASVDITDLLLGGFRRKEYTHLQCGGLKIDQPEPMDRRTRTTYIDVIGKGRRPRKASMTGYTRLGIELAREQARGRSPQEYVSEHNYQGLVRVLLELHGLGAPAVAPKDFRSTGCNYAQRLLHIQEGTRAARWGHGIKVHRSYYLVLTGAALKPCDTLEESMGCEHMMRRALRLLQIRNSMAIVPRTRVRTSRQNRKRVKALPPGVFTAASPGRPARDTALAVR